MERKGGDASLLQEDRMEREEDTSSISFSDGGAALDPAHR